MKKILLILVGLCLFPARAKASYTINPETGKLDYYQTGSSGGSGGSGFSVAFSSSLVSVSTMNFGAEFNSTVVGSTVGVGINYFNLFATPWRLYNAGSSRLSISADTTNTTYQTGLGNNLLFVGPANTTALATGNIQFKNLSTFSTNTSGQSIFMAVTPTVNSSLIGGNTDLLINRTQTGVGSGSQFLLDMQVSGVSVANIDNTGLFRSSGGFVSTANSFLATINNTSSGNNSRLQLQTTGANINRNVGDNNQALIVNQANASSTGAILDFQAAGISKASVTVSGAIFISSTINNGNTIVASTNTQLIPITCTYDGGGSAVVSGSTRTTTVLFDMVVTSWTVTGDATNLGSITVDIKSGTPSGTSYGTLTSIVGASGNKPTLTSSAYNTGTPTSWTTTRLNQGDTVACVNDLASTAQYANIVVWARKL